jgi:hypothetical protein
VVSIRDKGCRSGGDGAYWVRGSGHVEVQISELECLLHYADALFDFRYRKLLLATF